MSVIRDYTTSISAAKTAGEILSLLAEHGATRIAIDYLDGQPSGIVFQVATPVGDQVFDLPVDVDAMHRTLVREQSTGRLKGLSSAKASDIEQARRVAWRVIKDWVSAQMTIVATQMASLDQVMLPYLLADGRRTLYTAYKDRQLKAIEAGEQA